MNLDELRTLPRTIPQPVAYKRNRAGILVHPTSGEAMEVVMRGFGKNNGAAIRTGVLELIADETTGQPVAVIVNDSNMNGDGKSLRYSLMTGEILDTLDTGRTLLSDHQNRSAGFCVDVTSCWQLRALPASSSMRDDNVVAPRIAVLDRQPHETEEEYTRRTLRNGFKPSPEALTAAAAAKHEAWKREQLANSNLMSDGTRSTEPLEKPRSAKREKPLTEEELRINHRANAFSAGKEDEKLPGDPHFAFLK